MLKIDYYLGVELDATSRMLLQGHFFKWYQAISPHIDSRLISLPGGNGLKQKITRKISLATAYPLTFGRRENSVLHVTSVNLVTTAISRAVTSPLVVSCFDTILYEHNVEELAIKIPEKKIAAHQKIIGKADHIITVSKHARTRIAEVFRISPGKIDVAYNGVDHDVYYPQQLVKTPDILTKYGFSSDKKNILYVGSESPRKNLERCIRALPHVKKTTEINFVKVGIPMKPHDSDLRKLVHNLGLEDSVNFVGPVSAEDLPMLYNLADVFIFPSLYEGFGLPPLEAMACGCPVVTSNCTSLPEVVGDAAVVVDPYDIESIAQGMTSILSDDHLRGELIRKGITQAHKFEWQKAADVILNVYRNLMQ